MIRYKNSFQALSYDVWNRDQLILRRALADHYMQARQTDNAIAQLDAIGEILVEEGKKEDAIEIIQQILLLNPPNANDYRTLIQQLQAG